MGINYLRSLARHQPSRVNLVIVHYHFRPGGIRRVIELATPHLVRKASRPITRVVLATSAELNGGFPGKITAERNGAKWVLSAA